MTRSFAASLALLGLLLSAACATSHVANPPLASAERTLAAAQHAFEGYDLARSRRIYAALADDHAVSAADRATALAALARYAAKFDLQPGAAARHLDAALRLGAHTSALLAQRGRLRLDGGQLAAARDDAEAALAAATSDDERQEARLLSARVALAERRPERLRVAARRLGELLDRQPGRSEACELLLALALALDDRPLLLTAWKGYFLFADEHDVSALLRGPYTVLARLAASDPARPLDEAARHELALALAASRFYDHAAELAAPLARANPSDRALVELLAYRDFIADVAAVNHDFYPRVANGLRHYEQAYDAAITKAAQRLWTRLAHPAAAFDLDALFDLIRVRFGAEGYVGDTVGFHGLLMGHVIADEHKTIEQYGYVAEFGYVSIDRMLSRDFTSWYGTTNVGGWGTESTMVQVRAAYLDGPFRRLSWVRDPTARAEVEAELARDEPLDRARCAADRHAEPKGLAPRIILAASDELYAALQHRGLAGRDLALAFVAEVLRLNVEATVFAHEGRHALDQRYLKATFDKLPDDERELRAKYSEVAFSANPKLALTGSILGSNLDDSSNHGKANHRFRVQLVDWMQAHAGALGLDGGRPLILQVDGSAMPDWSTSCAASIRWPSTRRRRRSRPCYGLGLNVAICQTLPQRSSTMARRSPYGVSIGASSDMPPAFSALS